MDLLAYRMAEYMLDKAISADELRGAISTAIDHIEANPTATKASELQSVGAPKASRDDEHLKIIGDTHAGSENYLYGLTKHGVLFRRNVLGDAFLIVGPIRVKRTGDEANRNEILRLAKAIADASED